MGYLMVIRIPLGFTSDRPGAKPFVIITSLTVMSSLGLAYETGHRLVHHKPVSLLGLG